MNLCFLRGTNHNRSRTVGRTDDANGGTEITAPLGSPEQENTDPKMAIFKNFCVIFPREVSVHRFGNIP